MFNWEKRIHNNISIEIQSYKSKREGNSGERKNKNETVHHWADRHQFGPLSLFLHACARPRNLPVTDTRARVGSGRARAHHFHWCVDPRRQDPSSSPSGFFQQNVSPLPRVEPKISGSPPTFARAPSSHPCGTRSASSPRPYFLSASCAVC
jgi:hypothetical protein